MVKRAAAQKRAEEDAMSALEEGANLSASDSEAPEEESNAAGRRNVKGLDKTRQSAQKRSAKNKRQPLRSSDKVAAADDTEASSLNLQEKTPSKEEASTSAIDSTHRLDPALFAASFAKKKAIAQEGKDKDDSQGTVPSAKSAKTPRRLALGRDGQPMKRLKDGRTTVRVLPKPIRLDDGIDDEEEKRKARSEEIINQPILLDPSEVLPNAKVRAFKKRKLGLKEAGPRLFQQAESITLRTEDDPLGLEDPEFMTGGKYVKPGTAKRPNISRSKPNLLKGRRTKFTPAMSKHGQALHFARSL